MKKVNFSDISNMNVEIISVDDKYEFNLSHLPNSKNIPYDNLLANYRYFLSKDKKYYIYCKGGIKSKRIVTILEYLGYDVTLLIK